MMDDSSANTYIGITSALLTVLLVLTFILAAIVWYKSRQATQKKVKRRKPRLKINIKDVPKTRAHPPSAAYQILSAKDPPEFTIPPTPTLSSPSTPDSPRTPRRLFKQSEATSIGSLPMADYETPLGSPNLSPITTPRNSTSAAPSDLLYRRSASVPNEVFFSREKPLQELNPSTLWRSAISKTVAASLLSRPLRGNRKIMYATNGVIRFCLRYNPLTLELFIKILDLLDLPLTREKGVSYPYVQVFIQSDDENHKPIFYEVLNYTREKTCNVAGLTLEKIRASTLKFVVLDYDKFSRTEFVADAILPLEHVNIDGEEETRPLCVSSDDEQREKGELLISLCYQPNSGQVSVIVLKANGLPEGPNGSRPDYYVKITLLRERVMTDKRRTRVFKKSRCPVFNERLVFPVDEHGLRSICLVFDVIHHESRLKQDKIGNVAIGNNNPQRAINPLELKHFHEMLESPQKQIAEWHKIV